jgi:ribosomal protein S18 acetylase RimI-like enzyme
MSPKIPIPLTALRIVPGEEEYQALLTWPFPAELFYEGQVTRLLRSDIPFRVQYSNGLVWVYQDPHGNSVGFGTLDLCKDYEQFTNGRLHLYIPLLAVNPPFQRLGHGRSIVEHLIGEAVLTTSRASVFSDLLFLDVYAANVGAITLYEKMGFEILNRDCPLFDLEEKNAPYFVMAKRISLAMSRPEL